MTKTLINVTLETHITSLSSLRPRLILSWGVKHLGHADPVSVTFCVAGKSAKIANTTAFGKYTCRPV